MNFDKFTMYCSPFEFSFDGIEGLKNCHGHATWYLVRVVVEAIHGGVLPMISSCFVVCAVASVVADLLVARGKLHGISPPVLFCN